MPPDLVIETITLQALEPAHVRLDVCRTEPHRTTQEGRKLSITFKQEQSVSNQIFHLIEPSVVKIENKFYFRETLSHEKFKGFAFKKLTANHILFLNNCTHSKDEFVQLYHESQNTHPDFLYVKTF